MKFLNANLLEKVKPLLNPLCIALDVDDRDQALQLAHDLSEVAGGFKLGPRLVLRYGPQLIQEIANFAPVFLDFKYFDIPSTMVAAVKASFDAGASLVTVHAQAGPVALAELAKLEQEYRKTKPVQILAVTILTSFEEKTLPSILKRQSIETHVTELVSMVQQSGLTGIVCSPHELLALQNFENMYFVTPGIRGAKETATNVSEIQDQKRIMSAQEAIAAGATGLVVGRPIIEAASPKNEALKYSMAIFS